MVWKKGDNRHAGEDNPGHKLTAEQVLEVRRIFANRKKRNTDPELKIATWAKRLGLTTGGLSKILTGKTWKHLLPKEET